jgi:hypothetical protein
LLAADAEVREWTVQARRKARRYGSNCTGTFALAQFELLGGKRVATHWSAYADLAERCPDIKVDTNALFVSDGRLWMTCLISTYIKSCGQEAALLYDRGEVSDRCVHSHAVVEPLDPVHDVQSRLSAGVVTYLVDPLDFERLKKFSIAALSQALPFLLIDIVMAKSAAKRW